jgi:hypothetical protein
VERFSTNGFLVTDRGLTSSSLAPGSVAAIANQKTLCLTFCITLLDDFAYVSKDQAETSVLFELISARYERRSVLLTANQPFGEWTKVFPDPAMTVAAVDRLVHHSTIFELNVESYRRRTALQRKQQGPGRPASFATPNNVGVPPRQEDQQ